MVLVLVDCTSFCNHFSKLMMICMFYLRSVSFDSYIIVFLFIIFHIQAEDVLLRALLMQGDNES